MLFPCPLTGTVKWRVLSFLPVTLNHPDVTLWSPREGAVFSDPHCITLHFSSPVFSSLWHFSLSVPCLTKSSVYTATQPLFWVLTVFHLCSPEWAAGRLQCSGPSLSLKCVFRASSTVCFSSCEHHSYLFCYSPLFPPHSGRIYAYYPSRNQTHRNAAWDSLCLQFELAWKC